jgi:hypothetical protein
MGCTTTTSNTKIETDVAPTLSTRNEETSNQTLEDRKNTLFMQLSKEELKFIIGFPIIPFLTDPNNNPFSFYDSQEYMWQGVAIDVLLEIGELTGFSFELINDNRANHLDFMNLVESGRASFVPTLTRTQELEDRFIWSDNSFKIIFCFNKYEVLLCSIFNKTLNFIDVESIYKKWYQ